MIGITSYAAYVPRYRLDRSLIAQAWGTPQAKGQIAVAHYDEDALTMACEAAVACLATQPTAADALYFASTSSPYREKQIASLVATVADLPRSTRTADFGGSLRAGVSALLAAFDTVKAGSRDAVLVTAAEARLAAPESELEGLLGDAAAAVCVGREGVVAEIVGTASISEEFTHFWRTEDQRFVQSFAGRFSNVYGYSRSVIDAVKALLDEHGLTAGQLSKLAVASPDPRAVADVAKGIGLDAKTQVGPIIAAEIGSAGCADPMLSLAGVLDTAAPGDWIVVAGYGEGADALLLRATAALPQARAARSLRACVDAALPLANYQKYLKFRRIIDVDSGGEAINNTLEFKELKQDVRLYGSRCDACGAVQYPVAQVCLACRTRERLSDWKLKRSGTVFTFTIDHLIANIEHPLPMVVVDLDDGGRVYLQTTDFLEPEVEIGKRMILTYRRLHEGGGNYNYYWKARPVR